MKKVLQILGLLFVSFSLAVAALSAIAIRQLALDLGAAEERIASLEGRDQFLDQNALRVERLVGILVDENPALALALSLVDFDLEVWSSDRTTCSARTATSSSRRSRRLAPLALRKRRGSRGSGVRIRSPSKASTTAPPSNSRRRTVIWRVSSPRTRSTSPIHSTEDRARVGGEYTGEGRVWQTRPFLMQKITSYYVNLCMQRETRLVIKSTVFIILFGIISNAIIGSAHTSDNLLPNRENYSWACTTEVSVCPDNSYVTRVPPYCHFAECPD